MMCNTVYNMDITCQARLILYARLTRFRKAPDGLDFRLAK